MLRRKEYAWGRLLWLLGRRPPQALTEAPDRPLGAKFEITYACNLRCGFCYTDSPRRTLQRTPELSDEQWHEVVGQALELGIVEAVVTGGEPLLRKELTLGVVERLAEAGVGVTLTTNGWFVDEGAARRLGSTSGVTAHVSVDGARAGLHDASRGVPGSWRRAVEGIDRLLSAGVGVCVVHVVTPDNADAIPDFLEQMWTLGVPWVRITRVVVTGAAARGGDWSVPARVVSRAAEEFKDRHGTAMRVLVQPGIGGSVGLQGRVAPGSFLVRPNGDVRPDSLRPFTFGNAISEGVETCWQRVRDGWDDERINRWAGSIRRPEDLQKSELISYLDDEVPIGGAPGGGAGGRDAPVPEPTPPKQVEPSEEMEEAREKLMRLALSRRYRCAPLRSTGSPQQRFVRLASDGRYLRLNESSGVVMDALEGGTIADAAAALTDRYGISPERAREDAIAATRELVRQRIVLGADANHAFALESGTTDLPGLEPEG
jgi:MoaA/NifB/PqqE/SkfB family radical SAM enzyme